ncbi:POTRA domain-containing protein, partial [Cobetia sp. SIMBA_158]|uniref:POTRA domain-containing protein n=1 Tax=Cobetia sp. SIMBA_158 TaxID=3081617 RepID=UPI0039814553
SVEELDRNRVQVNTDVKEGAIAKIHPIHLVGNDAFDDEPLREQLELEDKPSGFFGWFSDDEYSREKVTGDSETLKS